MDVFYKKLIWLLSVVTLGNVLLYLLHLEGMAWEAPVIVFASVPTWFFKETQHED